jgi:hypothetical protein
MTTLVILCALLTAAALFFVFRPLLVGTGSPFLMDLHGSPSQLKRLLRKKQTVYENIKDLDFEYKMGKLADDDYERLRSDYEREAYAVIKEIEDIQPEPLQKAGQPQVVAVLRTENKSKQ